MSFDNPFDAARVLNGSGCACGQHASQAEHDGAPADEDGGTIVVPRDWTPGPQPPNSAPAPAPTDDLQQRVQQALADVQLYKALGGGFAPAQPGAPGGGLPRAQAGADMTPLAARTPQ